MKTALIYKKLPPGRPGQPRKKEPGEFYRNWSGLRYNGVIASTNRELAYKIGREIRKATGVFCRVDRAGRNARVQSYFFPNWIVFVEETRSRDPLVLDVADRVFHYPEEYE